MHPLYEEGHIQSTKLRNGVLIIGWIGEMMSCMSLIVSAILLHYNQQATGFMMHLMSIEQEANFVPISHFLIKLTTLCYVMSLINILVCTCLIIGASRGCPGMLLPWLVWHGILFLLCSQISFYLVLATSAIDFSLGLLIIIALSLGLYFFFQIYREVLMLFRSMDVERNMQRNASPIRLERICTSEIYNGRQCSAV